MATLTIKFLKDHVVKDEAKTTWKQGQVVELPYASAQHYLTRNLAILKIDDEPEPTPKPEPDVKPKKKGK